MKKNSKKKVCKWYNVCPIKYYTDSGELDRKWVENYCLIGNKSCKRYQLEEKFIYHPDNMLPNGKIDKSLN